MKSGCLLGRVVLSAFLLLALSTVTGSRDHHAPPDDALPPDDGSGPDDEDMADLFGLVSNSDVIIRCYRCTGVLEQSGCNVTSFYEHSIDYITDCNGHCINITSAAGMVFDCTADVPAKASACFQKGDMTMCVCTTDLCNAFPPPPPTPTLTSTPARPIAPPSSSSSPSPSPSSRGLPPVQPRDDGNMELPTARDGIVVSASDLGDGVVAGGVNVTFPEPSKHRQNNNTYIEARNVRSGEAGSRSRLYHVYFYSWCCICGCLSYTIVFLWGFCRAGERGIL